MWTVFSATTTGQRNLDAGASGQDAFHACVKGDLLVAVVCDGAGSVQAGHTGATFVTQRLAQRLAVANAVDYDTNPERLALLLRSSIEAVRAELASLAESQQLTLQDYACTVVGCIATRCGGCFFHIGDGFAIQHHPAGHSVLSRPENGEYADETYFVTDANWQDHLRLTPLSVPERGSLLGLMSDGTAPFAVNRERSGFFRPFIDPITAFLRQASVPAGNAALENLLQSPRASEISADDKTLILAIAQ